MNLIKNSLTHHFVRIVFFLCMRVFFFYILLLSSMNSYTSQDAVLIRQDGTLLVLEALSGIKISFIILRLIEPPGTTASPLSMALECMRWLQGCNAIES
jgi:hypothetical protein